MMIECHSDEATIKRVLMKEGERRRQQGIPVTEVQNLQPEYLNRTIPP